MADYFYSLDTLLSFYTWWDWSDSRMCPSKRMRRALAVEENQ